MKQSDGWELRALLCEATQCVGDVTDLLYTLEKLAICLDCIWEMLQSAEPTEFKQKFAWEAFYLFVFM